MMFLKQSTASQSIKLGPFVDSTDGVTAETGLTIANTDIQLSKNGGTMASKNSGGGTHDANGWYTITLDATDTNTVGTLQVSCAVSGALPVFMEFQVVEEAVYDALFASGGQSWIAQLSKSAGQIISGTVSNAVLTPTTTAFAADDITEATADHYNGRIVIFTSGALAGQATDITDYSLVSSEGNFTVTAMTEAPANNDTFIIV